jgi:amino acid permease
MSIQKIIGLKELYLNLNFFFFFFFYFYLIKIKSMEIIDLEDPDFQAPIIPATTDVSKKRSIEEEEEEEENTPERLNCSLCELPWTTQGAHRIVHLKCGDVFGKR